MHHTPDPFAHDDDSDLVRWFEGLGAPPEGQVSPYLPQRVVAQIDQRRTRRGIGQWLTLRVPPLWHLAFTGLLLLALGLNLWWGVSSQKGTPPGNLQDFQGYRFVQHLQPFHALGDIVAARSPFAEPPPGLGFAPQDARVGFFRLGTLYTDVLVALHSNALATATQHLQSFETLLGSVQAPQVLRDYVREMAAFHHDRQYNGEELAKFFALFAMLSQAEYASSDAADAVALFHIGAWVEQVAVAVLAGEAAVLPVDLVWPSLPSTLTQVTLPVEIQQALQRLQRAIPHLPGTAEDRQAILSVVQEIQRTLGHF